MSLSTVLIREGFSLIFFDRLCCGSIAAAASGFYSSEPSYKAADESGKLSNYMRDDKGLLLINDDTASLFRNYPKLRSYYIVLLTAAAP